MTHGKLSGVVAEKERERTGATAQGVEGGQVVEAVVVLGLALPEVDLGQAIALLLDLRLVRKLGHSQVAQTQIACMQHTRVIAQHQHRFCSRASLSPPPPPICDDERLCR
jgi:predicted phosphoribosyltransferase